MERIFLCFDLRAMRGASVAIRSRPRRPLARSLRVRPMRNMVQGETPPPVFRNGGNGPMNCAGRQVATVHRLEFVSRGRSNRSEEHTSELQSLMRISYAVFCLKKKNKKGNAIDRLEPAYVDTHSQWLSYVQ